MKEAGRYVLNDNLSRIADAREVRARVRHRGHAFEHRVLALPIDEIGRCNHVVRMRVLNAVFPNDHQAGWITVGQRSQQESIDY